jgi:plastocyanin
MSKTSRRDLLRFAATGSAGAGLGWALSGGTAAPMAAAKNAGDHQHGQVSGPMATATVSFGQWPSDPPLDRHPNLAQLNRNGHQLIPHEVTIKAGGTVNFIIAGLHQVIVYDDGIEPGQINTGALIAPTGGGPAVLIDDPRGRLYRGLDPTVLPLLRFPPPALPPPASPQVLSDRVEVVHFPNPGTFLVICGIVIHFSDGMFGWVRVLP